LSNNYQQYHEIHISKLKSQEQLMLYYQS